MEVFKVFATLSLVDLMSGPLARVNASMKDVDAGAASLSSRFAGLAASMAPLAIGAGAVLGIFGKCVATAAGFEDQMAKVGAVSRASAAELQQLEARARELGASTQFTASQVGEAEQYLAMAGFSVKENIAALPGVLNLAAATATDLGRAADISSDIMSAFGIQASEMGHVADVLTATCNSANTNMEMLGDTMKYVGPVAKTAGLSLEETATMAGILANSGIKASQGGTVLRSMLNRLAAPTGEAAKTLQGLGIATQDAAGNLKKPITILREMAAGMKGMGNAAQMAALKTVFGEEAMAGVSVLLQNANGDWNNLFETLSNVDGVSQKTADAMNNTLGGDLRGMGSAFESVQITIGKIFIPVLRKVVQAITSVLRWLDRLAQSPLGKFFLQLAAAVSTVIVGITAFSAAMWGLSSLGGLISRVFLPLKAAIMGVSAPMLAIIGIGAAIYAAWKTDFGGIATVVSGWWKNIKLVANGVIAVFQNLAGATGEIRGELAKEIKAAGLENLVTTISKLVFRIREFFRGIWDGLNFDGVATALAPAILKIRSLFDTVGQTIGKLFGVQVTSAANEARSLGSIVGGFLSRALESLATAINVAVNAVDSIISLFRMLAAIFTGDFGSACEMAGRVWQNLLDSLLAIADLFGIGDYIREFAERIKGFFANLNFVDGIKAAWNAVTNFLAGLNPLELISSAFAGIGEFFASLDFAGGFRTAWQTVADFIAGLNPVELIGNAFAGLTEFFASLDLVSGIQNAWQGVTAFFDGLNLFESGAKLISTLMDGIMSMAGSLLESVTGIFRKIRNLLPFSDAREGPLSTLTLSGSRLMTTLAEGVNQGKGALTAAVTGALGETGREIAGFRSELAQPEIPDIPIDTATEPALPDATAVVAELPAIPLPDKMPRLEISAPVLPDLRLADIELPDLELAAINLPPLPLPENLPQLAAPQIPPLEFGKTPEITEIALPRMEAPHIPELKLADIELPGLEPPAIAIPEAPAVTPESTTHEKGREEGVTRSKAQNVTVTIHNLHMPDVTDASGFVESLLSAFQSEIGTLEGMA